MEREVTDAKQRGMIRSRIERSDEKIQSLALLMLHYCAGLQHCLDQQEEERLRQATEPQHADNSQPLCANLTTEDTPTPSPVTVGVEVTKAENGSHGNGSLSIRVPMQDETDKRIVDWAESTGERSSESSVCDVHEGEPLVASRAANQVNGQLNESVSMRSVGHDLQKTTVDSRVTGKAEVVEVTASASTCPAELVSIPKGRKASNQS